MFLQWITDFFRGKKQIPLDDLVAGDLRRDGKLSLDVAELILHEFSLVLQNQDQSTAVGLMFFSEDALGASLKNVELAFLRVFESGCNGDLRLFQVYEKAFKYLERYLTRDDYFKLKMHDEFISDTKNAAGIVDPELSKQILDARNDVVTRATERGKGYEKVCNDVQAVVKRLAARQNPVVG